MKYRDTRYIGGRDTSQDSQALSRRPVPCLLDEANDKFAHFNGLVCLESDDLL